MMKLCTVLLGAILLTTGCGQKVSDLDKTSSRNDTPAPSPIQDYDIVTTTYNGSDELAVSAIVEPGVQIVQKEDGQKTAVPTQSYTAAVNDYGNVRFQFVNCAGTPGVMSIKKGTNFMIDNRDNKTHTFGIGPNDYELKAYDFALVNVKNVGEYFITCDGGGSAKISIQG